MAEQFPLPEPLPPLPKRALGSSQETLTGAEQLELYDAVRQLQSRLNAVISHINEQENNNA